MSSNIRITKICQHCRNQFVAKKTVTKFCSHNCARRAYKNKITSGKLNQVNTATQKELSELNVYLATKDFLNISEASQLLGASRWTIHRLIKKGTIKASKLGSRTVIARHSIDKLFQS